MQGRRSGSERKLSKTHGQKHKTKQKDSARARQNITVKYLNRKIVEELHGAIIAETHDQVPERAHVLNPSVLRAIVGTTQEVPLWTGALPRSF